jgi:hypothetical protein
MEDQEKFDYKEAETQYWYSKYHSLLEKQPYAVSFDVSDQEIQLYTKLEWEYFLQEVKNTLHEMWEDENPPVLSDQDLLEYWNDEFFWKII